MKKSTLIVSLLVTSLIAFAAVWFWALRPYITPLVSSHSVHTEGHAIEYVRSPLQAPPADLVRHIWHFRLIQPEPTAVGACRSAIAVLASNRRWLSFLR